LASDFNQNRVSSIEDDTLVGNFETVGRTADTAVVAFTDGYPGLQSIRTEAGITKPPIADWFHVAMRLQHARQAASGLSTDQPHRVRAKTAIIAEVERLHWRIWNRKATDAQLTIERIRKFMHVFKGERGHRTMGVPSRKLWHALREVNDYLRSQSARLINYAERFRAGLRVGTSVTEGTANFLVNRRMNKSQQTRCTRRGADLQLQVRCAACNGKFGRDSVASLKLRPARICPQRKPRDPHFPDTPRDARRGPGEVPLFCDGQEIVDVAQFHPSAKTYQQ
jgi:hypothetical protein